ncbi:tetratricopeptide repeat protein [Rhabdochlamydiaceae symbiont of Dictyostelium giganteum]|uniref:tetratricopeptide repeat protein n=1 Tax=Rhabdochlamydiaceae symbiont of Dictyostelium giganteum TaxID=3342349 RepID=UPI00384B74E4
MSAPVSSIQHQNNQPLAPIPSKPSALVTSSYQEISSSHLDIKSMAINSVQKEQMRSFMKTYGFDDAFIQTVQEENLQSREHLADHLFSHILNEMISEEWEILSYDHLLKLYDLQGMNLVFAAIREGNKKFFSYIINHISENDLMKLKGLEEREELRGKTLLHLIAIYGREDMLETLLHENSGIVNIKDKDALGLTALHLATHEGHEGVLQKLLNYGITGQELELEKHSISIIALAVASGDPNILALLLKHNQFKEISLLDPIPDVKTVLHLAIHLNQPKMLEHLLNHEHDSIKHLLEMKDASGRVPLQLAAFLGDLFAIKALVDKAVHIHKGELEKCGTALHFAVKGKQPDAITLLLSLGADPHKIDEAGKAPLAYLHGEEAEHIIMKRCKNILENFIASKRLEKVKVVDFNERAPFNLILEGGYQQKEGFVGIIKGLESKKILKDIRRFSGVGMGGIIATLLALGCTSSQIEELPFSSLQDLFNIDSSLTHPQLKELDALYFSNSSKEKRSTSTLALCQMKTLQNSLAEIITNQTEIENLTLKELAEKIRRYPERYKHIHLSVYSLKTQKTIQFTSEDPKYGDFLLSDVLAATLAFPGIFKPFPLRRKNSDGDLYDDTTYGKMGAPSLEASLVDQFDDLMYQEDPYYQGKQTNYRTLALKLDHQADKKNKLTLEPLLLSRFLRFYMDKREKKISSEEISRGRIKTLSFLEDEEDHITAAEKQIRLLFSSAKKTSIENSFPLVQPRSKGNLTPWKYDIFLKNNALSNESSLAKSPSCLNNIPQREILFTGRVKELNDLKTRFKDVSKVAIAGLGGMGKSTLSFKYASELIGYKFIHLIKATAPDAVRAGLIELAGLLNIKKEKPEDTLAEFKVSIQQIILPGLIIVDGADEESFFKELSDYIPHGKKCHILISTRIGDKAKVNGFHVISLKEFSKEEAICYLTKVDKPIQEEQQAAERLARAVGHHPLALSHIARYLEQEMISLCQYEERFKERHLKLPGKDDINLPVEEVSIFITWQVSLEAISQKERGTLAIGMMKMIALLEEEDIPFDLLHTWAKKYHPDEDDIAIAGAIKLLKDYTFFQEKIYKFDKQKYYQIHSLVQKVTAYQLELSEKSSILQEAIVALNQEITELRRPHRIPNWNLDERLADLYQVHIVKLYEIEGKQKTLSIEEYVQLLSHLGWILSRNYFNRDELLKYIDQGIKLGKALPHGAESLIMAELYCLKSKLMNNEQLGRESLKIRENIFGRTSEYTVESYDNLSDILKQLGKQNESLILGKQVLEIRRKNLGEGSELTSKSYDKVIDLLREFGQKEKAFSVAQKMLETRREALGEGNKWTSKSYNKVIDLLRELGQKEEAFSVAQKMLETRREVLGEGNKWTFKSYDKVIDLLKEFGRKEEALSEAQQILAIRREKLGKRDHSTFKSHERIIDLFKEFGQKEKALFEAQQMLEIRREELGEGDYYTFRSYERVIDLLKELDRKEEAISLAQHMLKTIRKELGEGNYLMSHIYNSVIYFLNELGEEKKALTVAYEMLETRRKVLEERDEWISKSYAIVINLLRKLGQREEALTLAHKMLETRRKALGEGDKWSSQSYAIVIDLLKELGKEEEVLSLEQ